MTKKKANICVKRIKRGKIDGSDSNRRDLNGKGKTKKAYVKKLKLVQWVGN